MRYSNLHTHTTFSDGRNTVRECIDTARANDMISLGISDHSYTDFDVRYCMRPATHMELYESTMREEQRIAMEEHGFPVFMGVEYDFGSKNEFENYDYTIGSVHYILLKHTFYSVDSGLDFQKKCIQNEFHGNKLDYVKAYFDEVVEHARKNRPDVLGHFDLFNKYSYFDEEDPAYLKVAFEAMDEALKYVPIFEINAGAMIRGLRDIPYPNPSLWQHLREKGGKVIVSSDAHAADKILYHFPDFMRMLKEAGFTHVSRLVAPHTFVEDLIEV